MAQGAPSLRSASSFAILSGASVTNSGPSRVVGNVGSSTASPVTGFTHATLLVGDVHQNDDLAREAQGDVAKVYQDLVGLQCSPLPPNPPETNPPLTNAIKAGVYCLSFPLPEPLILDGESNPEGFWVFRTEGDLTTASNSSVVMTSGGLKDHVFWLAGGSVTLGARSVLLGNILALSGITLNPLATLYGRAFARDGPVAIDTDVVSFCCDAINVSPAAIGAPPYNETITATGGTAPYTFELFAGSLAGLLLGSNGTLSGTPSTPGAFGFTVIATDAHGCSGLRTYAVCPTITLAPLDPPTCAGFNQTIIATGGTGSYSFHSADLPASLGLTTGGVLTGPSTPQGCSPFTVTATDASGCSGSRSYTVCLLPPVSLPGGTVGVFYSSPLTPSGGTAPYTLVSLCGPLPPGLSGPLISPPFSTFLPGIPTKSGSYTFTVTFVDAAGTILIRDYTIVVSCPAITIPPALPDGIVGVPYSETILPTGGTPPYTFTPLPPPPLTPAPGLALLSNGTVLGTPTATGTFMFPVTVTDALGCTVMVVRDISIHCPVITLLPAALPNATVGIFYSQQITVTPPGPYAFTLTSGAPVPFTISPISPSFASSGLVSGPPSTPGIYTFTVTATDTTTGCSNFKIYTVTVMPAPICFQTLSIAPATLPNGSVGLPYSQTLTAIGGTPPYTFVPGVGPLPAGLGLSTAGVLSGLPLTVGSYCFSVVARDANGCSGASSDYTVVIDPASCPGAPLITISPAGLPGAILNTPYSQTITASGGTPPYTFTVTSGALPPVLSLNSLTGLVSGTPTAVGIYPLMITVTDANGCFATMRCSMFMTVDIPALSGAAMLLLSLVLAIAGCVAMRRYS